MTGPRPLLAVLVGCVHDRERIGKDSTDFPHMSHIIAILMRRGGVVGWIGVRRDGA